MSSRVDPTQGTKAEPFSAAAVAVVVTGGDMVPIASAWMIKDIHPGTDDSSPGNLTEVDGTIFFVARNTNELNTNDYYGSELWKSDGTAGGTVMVQDINPDGDSYPYNLTNVGGTLYFIAYEKICGYELWRIP